MVYITKRDGRKVLFNSQKIIDAILAAFKEVDGSIDEYAKKKAERIAEYISNIAKDKDLTIEEIQDYVENGLSSTKRKDVAKAYILYREARRKHRMANTTLIQNFKEKLLAENLINQNANVDESSFGGRKGEATSIVMKQYALDYCMSEKSRKNHLENRIYIHDLDSYAVGQHNCLSIPFDELLANGFNTRQVDIRPANSLRTAFQLLAVIFQIQSLQQFGGCSATHLDWTMVPYVRKSFYKHYINGLKYCEGITPINKPNKLIAKLSIQDSWYAPDIYKKAYKYAMDMTKKELEQSVEGMYHNLNSLQSRSGNQLPFTSINYGTCTLLEGRMVIKALLEGSIKGTGKFHKTSIFPCGIFQLGKGINEQAGDPNYDLFQLALKSTAQRLYPNYANIDWSGNIGYDPNDPCTYFSTMGCRTANGTDINAEPGVNPQTKDGRGNICPVTIILPTLAMEAEGEIGNKNIDNFIELLDRAITDAKDMLIERFEYICSQDAASAKFMYENHTMLGYKPEEGIRSALKHGTLAVGQIALAECLQLLIGCDHTTDNGMQLAKKIETLFKQRCAEFKEQYKLNFGVYFTPAESLCYTACTKFKEKYGVIKNVSDKEFFTNSIHVPVWIHVTPFEKIDIESQLTGYSSAGCIVYTEFESSVKNNLEALEQVVLYAMKKDIPYFAINVPCDTCLECGYTDDMNDTCLQCGSKHIQRLRRVTGYLTGDYKTAFNKGKQQETEMRYKHSKSLHLNRP